MSSPAEAQTTRSNLHVTYATARWVFLRGMGLVYLIAFVSLWVQIDGLIGARGILPAHEFLTAVHERLGAASHWTVPSLYWLHPSDAMLHGLCAAGVGLSAALIVDLAPAAALAGLWLTYVSLSSIGQDFLSFQWDALLLETGFLAIFFAPLRVLPRGEDPPPSRISIWLFRWLLFRLMFSSGMVKLLSGDPTWRNLTALLYHYETQPLPTWLGWYAHQLPAWFQRASCAIMFVIELAVPWLIFGPRLARRAACAILIGLQLLIAATGNYCFFNLLTVLLCLLLLDDEAWPAAARAGTVHAGARAGDIRSGEEVSATEGSRTEEVPPVDGSAAWRRARLPDAPAAKRWPTWVLAIVAVLVIPLSLLGIGGRWIVGARWMMPLLMASQLLGPFRTVNGYGLFAVMTTERQEIVIEGSRDGQVWESYEFTYKPGDLRQRPRFVAPHQPRLDWQMWFAALADYRRSPWFLQLCRRLLEGSPRVTALLARNPFPDAPPRYLRAVAYDYRFTTPAVRRAEGTWWRRTPKGLYCPVLALNEG